MNVPALANVRVYVSPVNMNPESKLESVAVTVCGNAPLFTHDTVAPVDTVSEAGENAKSTMSTSPDPGAGGAVVVVVDGGTVVGVVGGELPPVTVMVPVISGCRVHK